MLRTAFIALAIGCAGAAFADPEFARCRRGTSDPSVTTAIRLLRRSVDPCGDSAAITDVLDRLERCGAVRYEVCTGEGAGRNLYEVAASTDAGARTIVWNPTLRSALEGGCDGDPARPVMRDPVASLLHELVHAAQDCEGLAPAANEVEAVRVENVYRRAAGLCQRTRYGDEPLPAEAMKMCAGRDAERDRRRSRSVVTFPLP